MAVLSPLQVAAAAYAGGFRGDLIGQAVAVASGESSWNTQAANSCCVGLWQINLKAHNKSRSDMIDPVKNATAAYQIYKAAGGWCTTGSPANHTCNPWQAYGNSAYQRALPQGKAAQAQLAQQLAGASSSSEAGLGGGTAKTVNDIIKQILGASAGPLGVLAANTDNPLSAAGDIAGVLSGFIATINRMGAWITNPDNLMRIAKVGLGFAIILVGGAALMDKEIASLTPIGKIAKAIK